MYPIEEFKFDNINDELALGYITIHNQIIENLIELCDLITDEFSKEYINCFLLKFKKLDSDAKHLSKTIICCTKEQVDEINKCVNDKKNLKHQFSLTDLESLSFYDSIHSFQKKKKLNANKLFLHSILLAIFDYDGNRKKLLNYYQSKKIGVCLYCLAQNITIYRVSTTGKYFLQGNLDHIIAKEGAPFLSISINNLIPVCSHCNQRKQKTKFKYNPFQKNHSHTFNFENCIKVDENAEVNFDSLKELKIEADEGSDLSTKLNFKDLYQNFNENAEILVNRFKKFNSDGYLNSLTDIIKDENHQEVVDYFISEIPLTENNIIKHPLTKFKLDLYHQLKTKSKK